MSPFKTLASALAVLSAAVACGDDASEFGPFPEPPPGVDAGQIADAGQAPQCEGEGLQVTAFQSGFDAPVFVGAPTDDSRLFVVEKPGRIKIISEGQTQSAPFLDLSDKVQDGSSEQGLLGLAFHPDYANNGRFFVNYTAQDPAGATVIAEFTRSTDADLANAEETRLLTIPQFRANHNGGMMAFDPNGYLVVATGDGGGSGDPASNGQDTTTLLGALLRIDVDSASPYGIPSDNPYAGQAGQAEELWAIGLRNPWRFSFDRMNGDLYVGDVGQGALEEVDAIAAPLPNDLNFGWPIKEGTDCFKGDGCERDDLVDPVYEYASEGRCSVIGGYVYRGACLSDFQGTYFFADFCTNEIFSLRLENGAAVNPQVISENLSGADALGSVVSFGEDAAGELYIVSLAGSIYRFESAE